MATKAYSIKYRSLKKAYESIIGKTIADITWGRVVTNLRRNFSLKIEADNAQSIVERYARMKKRCPVFSFKTLCFKERWQAFKHFYDLDVTYSGKDSLTVLADYLGINIDDVPRSTRYYWFSQTGLSYKAENIYGSEDLALVAFVATQWAINKRSQPMKSADPENNKLAA